MKKRRSSNRKSERRKFTIESNMASSRFASLEGSIERFIEEQEKQNTVKEKKETRRCFVDRVPSKKRRNTNWNSWNSSRRAEWTFEWIYFKRSHKRRTTEITNRHRFEVCMVASFERHLKRKSYPVSIINDLAFEVLRKTLHSKQKQPKKQGKGNKPHALVALTEDEMKILY